MNSWPAAGFTRTCIKSRKENKNPWDSVSSDNQSQGVSSKSPNGYIQLCKGDFLIPHKEKALIGYNPEDGLDNQRADQYNVLAVA